MKAALKSLEDRAVEWLAACVMLAWAFTLLLPGEMLSKPRFIAFNDIPLGDDGWAIIFLIVGMFHLMVLYINGRSPKTPYFRVAFSIINFAIFFFIAVALMEPIFLAIDRPHKIHSLMLEQTKAGPGWLVYSFLSVFSWFSIYRATKDTRYDQARKELLEDVANDDRS